MSTMVFEFDEEPRGQAKIKILGVGGAGCNAVDRMIESGLSGVEFIALNTDAQALIHSKADIKIQIGKELTKGLGAGGNPEVGMKSMEESKEKLTSVLADTDMVFIAAGMGGGTGTGAAPVVANIAADLGALTVSVVTKPFTFEGNIRMKNASKGVDELKKHVDTLIVIPNQRLIEIIGKETTMENAFGEVDMVLYKAAKGITDLINLKGKINLDFSDVKTTMKEMGDALMGVGEAEGEHKCVEAAQSAIQSPLLENIDITGAKSVLVNICGGKDITMFEINDAMNVIYERAGSDANIIFGTVIDPEIGDKVRVTVIATGFDGSGVRRNSEKAATEIPEPMNFTMDDEEDERDAMFSTETIFRKENLDEIDFEVPAYMRNNRD